MGRVSQEHGPSHFLSTRSILELEPHGQGGPQVNHGRRKQEQPGENRQVSSGPTAPSAHSAAAAVPGPGLLQGQGKAGCPDQPPEEPHGCKTRSAQTRLSVCSSLVGLGLGAE